MSVQPFSVNLDTSDPDAVRSERHGYVNLINVIHAELQLVERMLEMPGSLRSAIRLCETAAESYRDHRLALREARDLETFAHLVRTDLLDITREAAGSITDDVTEAVSIIEEVLTDADLRVQETLAIHGVNRPCEVRTFGSFASDVSGSRPATIRMTATDPRNDEIEVPYRFAETLGRLVRSLAGLTSESEEEPMDAIELSVDRGSEALRVTISGSVDLDRLLPLTGYSRPGVLMADELLDQRVIRPALLLWYIVQPGGSISLLRDEDGHRTCVVTLPQTTQP